MRIPDSNSIDSASGQSSTTSVNGVSSPGGQPGAAKTNSHSTHDQVSLSSASQLLRTSASEREQRLAALTATVRSGQYQASALSVAQAITTETLARSGTA